MVYGIVIISFCLLVAVNCRFFVKPLVALIISSILFFYVEFDRTSPELISQANLSNVQTLATIIGGLFLIHGFSSIPTVPLAAPGKPVKPVKVPQPALAKPPVKGGASAKGAKDAGKGSEKKPSEPETKKKGGAAASTGGVSSQSTTAAEPDWTYGTGGGGKRKNK